jgi:hypothetical protein
MVNIAKKNAMKFKNEKQLEKLIDEYFVICGLKSGDEETAAEKTPTVSGLALALGFNSRKAMQSYNENASCRAHIERALLKIEEFAESKLFDKGQYSGAKYFLAGNFDGWDDKKENSAETLERLDNVLKAISQAMKM